MAVNSFEDIDGDGFVSVKKGRYDGCIGSDENGREVFFGGGGLSELTEECSYVLRKWDGHDSGTVSVSEFTICIDWAFEDASGTEIV